jgi:multisubunit Na+/H+ antiporter MnhF subunit
MRASSNSARSATLTETKEQRPAHDAGTVALLSACLTLAALFFCSQHQLLLLYGDAVAHLHIARRLFDSRSPGFRQLGSVWLPLPHLLLVPFVQKMSWWQSGVPGALPSMACYVAACVGLYRLALCFVRHSIAWLAVAFFALNPGLLYFSTTAMTEPLFLAEMVWAALLIALFARRSAAGATEGLSRLLLGAALVLVCAVFTRYDGWIYAAAAWCIATWLVARRRNLRDRVTGIWLLATVLVVMAPLLWMAYNAKQFHDPLDFLRGPYSARAIEARTSPAGGGHYPEYHKPWVATLYYLKAAELGAVVPYATPAPRRACGRHVAVAAAAVLCLLGGVWIGAHLHPGLVSALLVQHALRNGDAARLCAVRGCGAGGIGDMAPAVAAVVGTGSGCAGPCKQCSAAARQSADLSRGSAEFALADGV